MNKNEDQQIKERYFRYEPQNLILQNIHDKYTEMLYMETAIKNTDDVIDLYVLYKKESRSGKELSSELAVCLLLLAKRGIFRRKI